MPKQIRYRRRRRTRRVRKLQKTAGYFSRKRIGMQLNTHHFNRRVILYGNGGAINGTIVTNTGSGGGYATEAFNYSLSQLSNYNEFAALFDVFKITRVKLIVTCLTTQVLSLDANNYNIGLPKLYHVHDEDDVTAPANNINGLKEMQERVKTRMYSFTPSRNTVTIWVKPNLLGMDYKSATTTAYTPNYNRWVDMADVSIPYYGSKMLFQVPCATTVVPAGGYHAFQVDAVYYFSCKDVR